MTLEQRRQRARRLNDDAPDLVEKGDGGDEVDPDDLELDYSGVVEKASDEDTLNRGRDLWRVALRWATDLPVFTSSLELKRGVTGRRGRRPRTGRLSRRTRPPAGGISGQPDSESSRGLSGRTRRSSGGDRDRRRVARRPRTERTWHSRPRIL